MRKAIAEAIKRRKCLTFTYDLEVRRVEPYALGYNEENRLALQAWQWSGDKPGFRNFLVSKISGLKTLRESFVRPDSAYHPTGMRWHFVERL